MVVESGCEGCERGLRLRAPGSSDERMRVPEKKEELEACRRWSYWITSVSNRREGAESQPAERDVRQVVP